MGEILQWFSYWFKFFLYILSQISLRFVPGASVDIKSALIEGMAWFLITHNRTWYSSYQFFLVESIKFVVNYCIISCCSTTASIGGGGKMRRERGGHHYSSRGQEEEKTRDDLPPLPLSTSFTLPQLQTPLLDLAPTMASPASTTKQSVTQPTPFSIAAASPPRQLVAGTPNGTDNFKFASPINKSSSDLSMPLPQVDKVGVAVWSCRNTLDEVLLKIFSNACSRIKYFCIWVRS